MFKEGDRVCFIEGPHKQGLKGKMAHTDRRAFTVLFANEEKICIGIPDEMGMHEAITNAGFELKHKLRHGKINGFGYTWWLRPQYVMRTNELEE